MHIFVKFLDNFPSYTFIEPQGETGIWIFFWMNPISIFSAGYIICCCWIHSWFSHDVTKIQTTKLSILLRFYFHDVLEQLKTNFHTNFRFKRVLGFVIEYAWISKHAFVPKLGNRCFCWFPSAMLLPSRLPPAWRLHLYIFGYGYLVYGNILDLNLGEDLCIFTFFHFPDSGLGLLNGFDFYFDLLWMAWHWKPTIPLRGGK